MLENHSYSVIEPSLDGKEGSISLLHAQQIIEEYSETTLDEVSPTSVQVAFCEYTPNGPKITPRTISTRVPMFAFNNMLANQKRMQKLRKKQLQAKEFDISDENTEEFDLLSEETLPNFATLTDQAFRDIIANSEPAIVWQAREVLTIWKLTPGEGEMSLKKLMLGLTFEQIQGLFSRFFGAMLRQKSKA
ncbi:MAG: hypothetical protein PVSMB5_20000 [Ktedonobacteraceae bacterium]